MKAELLCVPCAARLADELPEDVKPGTFVPGWSVDRSQCPECATVQGPGVQVVAFTTCVVSDRLRPWWESHLEEERQGQIHAWQARALLLAIASGKVELEPAIAGAAPDGTYWGYSGDVSFGTVGEGAFARWNLTFFNDCGELDYLDCCAAPDGRTGDYDGWTDGCRGFDPVQLLSDARLHRLEVLAETVKPRSAAP